MRILYIVDYSSFRGGASKSTLILAKEMVKQGNEVSIMCPKGIEIQGEGFDFVEVEEFSKEFPFVFQNPIGKIKLISVLHKEIEKISPDIIHIQMPRAARAVGLGRLFGQYRNIPILYTERELVSGLKNIYKCLYAVLVARPFDGVVCLSEAATKFWKVHGAKSITVIPNSGGEIYEYYDSEFAYKAYNLLRIERSDKLLVLFAGRVSPEKRWNLICEIIEKSEEEHLKVEFLVALSYSKGDKNAEKLLERLNKHSYVTVFENVPFESMELLYYVADIHIMTSSIESFGRTLIEAMSRRTAVLSTDAGPTKEIVGEQNIVDPLAQSFIKRIEWFDNNRDALESIKDEMLQKYKENYTLMSLSKKHLALYEEMLKNKR